MRTLSSAAIFLAFVAITQDAKPKVTEVRSATVTPTRVDLCAIEKKLNEFTVSEAAALDALGKTAKQTPEGKKLPRCKSDSVRTIETGNDCASGELRIHPEDAVSDQLIKKFNLRCAPVTLKIGNGSARITEMK